MNPYEILTVESFGEIAEQDSSHRDHSARAMLIGNDSRIVADVYTVADAEKIVDCVNALRPITLADGTKIPIDLRNERMAIVRRNYYTNDISVWLDGNGYWGAHTTRDIVGPYPSEDEAYCMALVAAGLIAKEEIE